MYGQIAERPSVREAYLERLLELKSISREEAGEIGRLRYDKLEQQLNAVRSRQYKSASGLRGVWRGRHGGPEPHEEPETGVPANRLADLLRKLTK